MAHPLDGAFAKYDAAHEHFKTLTSETTEFLNREDKPYSESLEFNDRENYFFVVAYLKEPLPIRFSTRVGDVVHNLASALDNAMFELAKLRTKREIENTSFPLYGDVRSYRRFRRKRACWLKTLTAADRALIQRFQPYRGGDFAFNHPLAQLYRLWNQDKHRAINTTFAMVAEYGWQLTILQDIKSVSQPQFRFGAVEDGTEVARWYIVPDGPAPQVKLNTEVTLDIGVDNGLRITHLLAGIADWVEHILNRVSQAFPESPTYDEWKAAQSPPPDTGLSQE